MSRQRLIIAGMAAAILATSTPAFADDSGQLYARSYRIDQSATRRAAMRWELGYLLLSAVDLAQTVPAVRSGKFEEGNPIVGKHPSTMKLILPRVALSAAHFMFVQRLSQSHPKAALRFAQVSVGLEGAVVGLNFKTIF